MTELSAPGHYGSWSVGRWGEGLTPDYAGRGYSRSWEWFVLLMWTALCWEGVFGQYFRQSLSLEEQWWMRLTPWNLYPSELVFYGPLLPLVIWIGIRGPRIELAGRRGWGLLAALWAVGVFQMLHGLWRGAPGNYWLADFRQNILMSVMVPFAMALGPEVRLDKLGQRFCRLGVLATIYCGVAGMLVFARVWPEHGRQVPYWHGSFVLILMYVLMLTRWIVGGRRDIPLLLGLAFGILAPLHKPAIGGFIVANGVTVLLSFIFLRARGIGLEGLKRLTLVLLMVGLFTFGLLSYVFTLGGGVARDWVARKFFKSHVSQLHRDLTGRRLELWGWGLEQWSQHPLIGTGYGIWIVTEQGDGSYIYVPIHNALIEALYETGISGFVVLACIVIVWLVRMVRYLKWCPPSEDYWVRLGMFMWIVTMLVTSCYGKNLGLTSVGFIFWMCVGFLTIGEARYKADNVGEWSYDLTSDLIATDPDLSQSVGGYSGN